MNIIDLVRREVAGGPCRRCGRPMDDCAITVLTEEPTAASVAVRCAGCGAAAVLQLVVMRQRKRAVADRARPLPDPITVDTVLDARLALGEFQGPLTALIS